MRYVARRLVRSPVPYEDAAHRSWILQPSEPQQRPRAVFLDGQLDRVEAVQEETTREFELARVLGGPIEHGATKALEYRDAIVAGGAVFAGGARVDLSQLRDKLAAGVCLPEETLDDAAIDCTWVGNRYFGHWLTDDTTLHLLARDHAPAVGVVRPPYVHEDGYSRVLGLEFRKLRSARIRRLLVFQDVGQNAGKRARYEKLRGAIAARARPSPRPVYLRRAASGVLRLLVNEAEIEERLVRRGFDVVDPEGCTAEQLVERCAGAPCFVSVEGSALAHGVLAVRPHGTMLALQPPWRFNNVTKDPSDCLGLTYGFVVGVRDGNGFRVDPSEVERTLDLCAARA